MAAFAVAPLMRAVFCDNHDRFLMEDIPDKVYTQLMTSNQAKMDVAGMPAAARFWPYILNETDY